MGSWLFILISLLLGHPGTKKTYLMHLICCQKIEFSSPAIIPTHRSILYGFSKIKWKSPKNAALKKDVLFHFPSSKSWMLFPQQIWLVNQKEETIWRGESMTSLSTEVRLVNAKKGYFYFHLMVCRFFKGQHSGSKKEKLFKNISHKSLSS